MYETKKIYDTRVFIQLTQADFERPAIGEIVTLSAKTHVANSSYPYVKVSSEFKAEWKIFTQKSNLTRYDFASSSRRATMTFLKIENDIILLQKSLPDCAATLLKTK